MSVYIELINLISKVYISSDPLYSKVGLRQKRKKKKGEWKEETANM